MALKPSRDNDSTGGLADVIDKILDKGLVINADIAVSVAGVELLGIKIRAALASLNRGKIRAGISIGDQPGNACLGRGDGGERKLSPMQEESSH